MFNRITTAVIGGIAFLLSAGCRETSREQKLLACLQEADDGAIAALCRESFDDRMLAKRAETAERKRLAALREEPKPERPGITYDPELLVGLESFEE